MFTGRHERRKVTDWVYEEVREAIIDLRLQPGEPLREATIAEQLGVSKTPVREALARLEQEGLVETTSFKGAVVSGYSRATSRRSTSCASSWKARAVRAVGGVGASEDARTRTARGRRAQPRRCAMRASSPSLQPCSGDSITSIYDQVDEPADPRADRQPAGPPHADRQAHRRASPAAWRPRSRSTPRSSRRSRAHDADEAERLMRAHIRSVLTDQLARQRRRGRRLTRTGI